MASYDARDTNHDGKVSLMEKVKDKLHHHKNTTTTHTTTTSTHLHNSTALPLAGTHHTATHTGSAPLTASVPALGAVPIIGTAMLPVAMGSTGMPLATGAAPIGGAPLATAGLPLATGAAYGAGLHDSRDLNRDGHVSLSEKLASSHISNGAAYDARDLNRDGHVSTSEKLAAGSTGIRSSGAYDARDLNRDGHVSTSEKLAAGSVGMAAGAHMSEEARLRLHEEQLAISKREVGAGEVDIHKRVVEQHVQQTVPVRREEVIVERRPLSGVASPNARIAAQDESMRVALFREEIVTEKRVVPTEEIIVRKKEVIDQQTVGATLRSEHVETFQTGATYNSGIAATTLNSTAALNGTALNGTTALNNGSMYHDARDTNLDGKLSLGERAKAAVAPSQGAFDGRDANRDGNLSMGERAKAAAAPLKGADARDLNRDGHVSMGEKLKSARG